MFLANHPQIPNFNDQCPHYKLRQWNSFGTPWKYFFIQPQPCFLFVLFRSWQIFIYAFKSFTRPKSNEVILNFTTSQTKNTGLLSVLFPLLHRLWAYSLYLWRQLITQCGVEPISNRTVSSFCGIQIQYSISNLELKKPFTSSLFKHPSCSDQMTLWPHFFNHHFRNQKPYRPAYPSI